MHRHLTMRLEGSERDCPGGCTCTQSLRATSLEALSVRYRKFMSLSARNQLRGQIKDVKLGNIMAHIVVQIGENEIESVITRRSAEEMDLKTGDTVTAINKSTEVMLQK